MTQFDFDTPIERRGTNAMKWDALTSRYDMDPENSIAMWVADMEFRAPPSVRERLQQMVDHGIFGYFGDDSDYRKAVVDWMDSRHGWSLDPAHIYTTNGVIQGLSASIRAFSEPGDGVIVFAPVYHVFGQLVRATSRDLVESPLHIRQDGRYEMDLDALQANLKGHEKIVIFCSPHNPGGRVWSKEEIAAVGAFCEKNDLLLISDEIHHDLVMPGNEHHVTATVIPDLAHRLITLSSASKTFNLAGGHVGQTTISDPKLRATFEKKKASDAVGPNSFGIVMTQAAYEGGEDWLEELITYIDSNRQYFDAEIGKIPGAKPMPLQATYLSWVDFEGCGHQHDETIRRVEEEAKIACNYGHTFGLGGDGKLRFNLACPRSQVEDAVGRLQRALA
ncbi:MAG: MalY/PatB family protein [Pseudomonadota bacterium]